MLVYGQLIKAQLENSSSDIASAAGMVYYNTTANFPKYYNGTTWKTLADTNSAQVFTAKDYDGGTASNTSRFTCPSDVLANLLTLTRKEGTLLYATDTNKLYQDDGATLTQVGAGTASLSANIRASEGAGTTTLTSADDHIQRFDLSADRTVVLPSTGVAAGDIWELLNPNSFTLTVQADDLTDIDIVIGGSITLVALISTPLTFSDWSVTEILSSGKYTPTVSNTTNIDATTVYGTFFRRVGKTVHVQGWVDVDPTAGGNVIFRMSLPISSNFATATDALGSIVVAGDNLIGQAYSVASTALVEFLYVTGGTSNKSTIFTYSYEVL